MKNVGRILTIYGVDAKTLLKKGKPGKKSAKEKDPNKPKKSPSAYILFCGDERPKLQDLHPTMSVGDIMKLLGEKWAQLTAPQKSRYEERAKELKTQRDIEMAQYEKNK